MIKKSLFAGTLLCLLMAMGCVASSSSSKLGAVDNVVPRVERLAYWKPVYIVIPPDVMVDGKVEKGSGRRIQQNMQEHMIGFARGIHAPYDQFGSEQDAMAEAISNGSRYAFFAYFNESATEGYTANIKVFDLQYGGTEHPVLDRSFIYKKGSPELAGSSREALSKRLYRKFVDDAYGPG